MNKVISDTKIPIKIWASDLEKEAEQQVRNLSTLPFIFKHIAVMADAHRGRGSTVGTVIATKGAIIPAAVGVDLGCFSGETKILLLDGTMKRLDELAKTNDTFWVYSINEDNKIVPGKAVALLTREDTEVMEITISGGETIVCTHDHEFLMRDGTYKQATLLNKNDSLMPFCQSGGNNHKVVSKRHLDKWVDVYCLQVEKYHNFALAAGVFVHNCGMAAQLLPFKIDRIKNLLALRLSIERSIPTGRFTNNTVTERAINRWGQLGDISEIARETIQDRVIENAIKSIGSLGGGNHFIEICHDQHNNAWILLHSGSRNIGKCLAEIHIDKAKSLMKDYFISLPDPDLAYLVQDTFEFKTYLHDLMWAQEFAKANREEMMDRVLREVLWHTGQLASYQSISESAFTVNCHHNYTAIEHHFGHNIYVTRKGAMSARKGQWGIIPGSMGTQSFIVKGLGNEDSFQSCSHGAGRKMSRTKARATFTIDDLKAQTQEIECRKDGAILDEIPSSYKDINEVMTNQKDLVEPIYELRQVICIKGD